MPPISARAAFTRLLEQFEAEALEEYTAEFERIAITDFYWWYTGPQNDIDSCSCIEEEDKLRDSEEMREFPEKFQAQLRSIWNCTGLTSDHIIDSAWLDFDDEDDDMASSISDSIRLIALTKLKHQIMIERKQRGNERLSPAEAARVLNHTLESEGGSSRSRQSYIKDLFQDIPPDGFEEEQEELEEILDLALNDDTIHDYEVSFDVRNVFRRLVETKRRFYGAMPRSRLGSGGSKVTFLENRAIKEPQLHDSRDYYQLFGVDHHVVQILVHMAENTNAIERWRQTEHQLRAIQRKSSLYQIVLVFLHYSHTGHSIDDVAMTLGLDSTHAAGCIAVMTDVMSEIGMRLAIQCDELLHSLTYKQVFTEVLRGWEAEKSKLSQFQLSPYLETEFTDLVNQLFPEFKKVGWLFEPRSLVNEIWKFFNKMPFFVPVLHGFSDNTAVDGTHINGVFRYEEKMSNIDYKDGFSLNACMTVHLTHFVYTGCCIVAGSTNDSRALKLAFTFEQFLKRAMVKTQFAGDGILKAEPDDVHDPLFSTEEKESSFRDSATTADNAFGDNCTVMGPYRATYPQHFQDVLRDSPLFVSSDQVYNYLIDLHRNGVERSFGAMKKKWRIIAGELRVLDNQTKKKIVLAQMGLHNITHLSKHLRLLNQEQAEQESEEVQQSVSDALRRVQKGSKSFNRHFTYLSEFAKGSRPRNPDDFYDGDLLNTSAIAELSEIDSSFIEDMNMDTMKFPDEYINDETLHMKTTRRVLRSTLQSTFRLSDNDIINNLTTGHYLTFRQLMLYNSDTRRRLIQNLRKLPDAIAWSQELSERYFDIMVSYLHNYRAWFVFERAFKLGVLKKDQLSSIEDYRTEHERFADSLRKADKMGTTVHVAETAFLGKTRKVFLTLLCWCYYLVCERNGKLDPSVLTRDDGVVEDPYGIDASDDEFAINFLDDLGGT